MEGLKELIQKEEKYSKFKLNIDSIETAISEKNTNSVIESSKSLIESVCKTISGDLGITLDSEWELPRVVKVTVEGLPFVKSLNERDAERTKTLCGNLVTLSKTIGELRNEYGFISHGQDLVSAKKADEAISKLAYNVADIICAFLLEFHINFSSIVNLKRLNYQDYEDFNEWLDDANEKVRLSGSEYLYSETLFRVDEESYKSALLEYEDDKIKNSKELGET